MWRIIIASLLLVSCGNESYYESSNIELRQLVNSNDTTKSVSGSFFLVTGSYSESTYISQTIKMYALVDGTYKYLEYDAKKIRIKIDNSIKKPFLVINYSSNKKITDEELTDKHYFYFNKIVLNTPEKYLPEHLLPITIE